MFKPLNRTVLALLIMFILSFVVVALPWTKTAFGVVLALLLILLGIDFVRIWRVSQPHNFVFERKVSRNLPNHAWSTIELRCRHLLVNGVSAQIIDHVPVHFLTRDNHQLVDIPDQQRLRIQYDVKPNQRGDADFTGVELILKSPWGFWQRQVFCPLPETVRVYPNFAEVSQYTLLANHNHLSQLGIHQRRRRGDGSDFHQLREYRSGDSPRQIDWKATSRHRKLIAREYQDERDQQIIFLLDCGRRMRHQESWEDENNTLQQGSPHLDDALNALLLLSHVALKQGDSIGFLSFAGDERWFAPQKGGHTVTHILERVYDLKSNTDNPDYLMVAKKLMGLQRRRAMIIILTNTRNEDNQELIKAAQLLARRHLVILADLQEPILQKTLHEPVVNLEGALNYHGVMQYLQERGQTHHTLHHAGIVCLDVQPKALPAALVNLYWDMKHAGRM